MFTQFKNVSFILLCLSFFIGLSAQAQETYADHLELGKKNYAAKEYREAVENFTDAILADGSKAEAYKWRADAYHKMSLFTKAVEDYEAAIKIDQTNAEAYFNLGRAQISMSKHKDALKNINKAIELNPSNAEMYFFRGNVYNELWNFKEALKDYDKAIEINPEYALAYHNRGAVLGEMGKFEQSLSDFKKVTTLDTTQVEALINIALSEYGAKLYESAIKDFTLIIERNGDYVSKAYYYRAEAYFDTGKTDLACADWKKAISLGYEDEFESLTVCDKKEKEPRKKKATVSF